MNIPFNIHTSEGKIDSEKESQLLKDIKAAGFSGLKGHRSLGGMRASIYNSLEYKDVEAFTAYLSQYEKDKF